MKSIVGPWLLLQVLRVCVPLASLKLSASLGWSCVALHHVLRRLSLLSLGSFSIDCGDGSENVMNLPLFKLCRVYSNSLKMPKVVEFPWS